MDKSPPYCQFKAPPGPVIPCAPTTSLACTGPTDPTCQTYATSHQECAKYTGTCVNQSCLFTPTSTSSCNPPSPITCSTQSTCTDYATQNPSTCAGFNAVCRADAKVPYCDFYQPKQGDLTCDASTTPMCGGDGSDATPCSAFITANPAACANYQTPYCNNGACSFHPNKPGQDTNNQALLSQVPHKRHDMQLSYASYSKIWN